MPRLICYGCAMERGGVPTEPWWPRWFAGAGACCCCGDTRGPFGTLPDWYKPGRYPDDYLWALPKRAQRHAGAST